MTRKQTPNAVRGKPKQARRRARKRKQSVHNSGALPRSCKRSIMGGSPSLRAWWATRPPNRRARRRPNHAPADQRAVRGTAEAGRAERSRRGQAAGQRRWPPRKRRRYGAAGRWRASFRRSIHSHACQGCSEPKSPHLSPPRSPFAGTSRMDGSPIHRPGQNGIVLSW